MKSLGVNEQQVQKMKAHPGFIAALDQSGGSTPEALRHYGIKKGAWSELSAFSRSQLDPIRAGNAGALFPKVLARLRHGRGEMI